MRYLPLVAALMFASTAYAATDPAVEAFNAAKTKIAEDYKAAVAKCNAGPAADKKTCLNTAKTTQQKDQAAARQARDHALNNTGVVQEVKATEVQGQGSGAGAVAGGVAGALIGKQLGKGDNSTLVAAAAGVAGAVAGNEIEKKVKSKTTYTVSIKLKSGKVQTVTQDTDPAVKQGDQARIVDGKVVKL
jgi:outer membrane lipoprotein SlyB